MKTLLTFFAVIALSSGVRSQSVRVGSSFEEVSNAISAYGLKTDTVRVGRFQSFISALTAHGWPRYNATGDATFRFDEAGNLISWEWAAPNFSQSDYKRIVQHISDLTKEDGKPYSGANLVGHSWVVPQRGVIDQIDLSGEGVLHFVERNGSQFSNVATIPQASIERESAILMVGASFGNSVDFSGGIIVPIHSEGWNTAPTFGASFGVGLNPAPVTVGSTYDGASATVSSLFHYDLLVGLEAGYFQIGGIFGQMSWSTDVTTTSFNSGSTLVTKSSSSTSESQLEVGSYVGAIGEYIGIAISYTNLRRFGAHIEIPIY